MKRIVLIFCVCFSFFAYGCKKMIRPTEVHGTVSIIDSVKDKEKTILLVAKNDHDKEVINNFVTKYNSDPFSITEKDYKSITNTAVNELGNFLYEYKALVEETSGIACFAWQKNYTPSEMKNITAGTTNLLNFELKPMNKLFIKLKYTGTTGSSNAIDKCTIKSVTESEEINLEKDNTNYTQNVISFVYKRTKLNAAEDFIIKAYDVYNNCIYTETIHLKANESKLIEREY